MLRKHGGKVYRVAKAAGLNRTDLYKKLKIFNIDPNDFR